MAWLDESIWGKPSMCRVCKLSWACCKSDTMMWGFMMIMSCRMIWFSFLSIPFASGIVRSSSVEPLNSRCSRFFDPCNRATNLCCVSLKRDMSSTMIWRTSFPEKEINFLSDFTPGGRSWASFSLKNKVRHSRSLPWLVRYCLHSLETPVHRTRDPKSR